jgi:hypothetical protein
LLDRIDDDAVEREKREDFVDGVNPGGQDEPESSAEGGPPDTR